MKSLKTFILEYAPTRIGDSWDDDGKRVSIGNSWEHEKIPTPPNFPPYKPPEDDKYWEPEPNKNYYSPHVLPYIRMLRMPAEAFLTIDHLEQEPFNVGSNIGHIVIGVHTDHKRLPEFSHGETSRFSDATTAHDLRKFTRTWRKYLPENTKQIRFGEVKVMHSPKSPNFIYLKIPFQHLDERFGYQSVIPEKEWWALADKESDSYYKSDSFDMAMRLAHEWKQEKRARKIR